MVLRNHVYPGNSRANGLYMAARTRARPLLANGSNVLQRLDRPTPALREWIASEVE